MARRQARRRTPARERAVQAPLPPAFVAQARRWLAEEAEAFLAACSAPPRLAIRASAARGGLAGLLRVLGAEATAWPRLPWWDQACLPPAEEAARLAGGPLAWLGALYAQDAAALAAVALLDPQPGERVLDLCAAPGGKSTAIADRLRGQGLLVSNDVDGRRARELERTLQRWGVANAAVLSLDPERLAGLVPGFFDRVLVDAPCSGEAMFARHARAAADWSPAHVAGCAARQGRLLHAARRLVRPGGLVVYSTCTFNPVENEGVVAAYLAAHAQDRLLDAVPWLPGARPGRPDLLEAEQPPARRAALTRLARLWPHLTPGAGHALAAIAAGDGDEQQATPGLATRQPPGGVADDLAAVHDLLRDLAPGLRLAGTLVARGDRAYLAPAELPQALIAVALAPGLRLAERRGRTWRPAQALAMALTPAQCARVAQLDDTGLAALLAGQPAAGQGHGITLATWRGYSAGWVRAREGRLAPLWPSGAGVVPREIGR